MVMPKGYEKMRNAIKKKMLKKGVSLAKADKEAKRIAAATWNKKHPKSPVTGKHHKKNKKGPKLWAPWAGKGGGEPSLYSYIIHQF